MIHITGETGLPGLLGSPVATAFPRLCTITAFSLLAWTMYTCALT